MDEAAWDDRYRSAGELWSGQPNPHLVGEAGGLAPGSALDVGCGEGADAIWLAERGWRVTAVDHSGVALERGAARADEVGGDVADRITWHKADLDEWEPEPGAHDLVSAQFVHLPADRRQALHAKLTAATAPCGVVVIVGHHPSDLDLDVARPSSPELLFTAAQVAATLDPDHWTVLVDDARPRPGVSGSGNEVTVHDTVVVACRGEG